MKFFDHLMYAAIILACSVMAWISAMIFDNDPTPSVWMLGYLVLALLYGAWAGYFVADWIFAQEAARLRARRATDKLAEIGYVTFAPGIRHSCLDTNRPGRDPSCARCRAIWAELDTPPDPERAA